MLECGGLIQSPQISEEILAHGHQIQSERWFSKLPHVQSPWISYRFLPDTPAIRPSLINVVHRPSDYYKPIKLLMRFHTCLQPILMLH